MKKNKWIWISIFILIPWISKGQLYDISCDEYTFINPDTNNLEINESPSMSHFFSKLDSLVLFGDRKLNIFHIGDSHIQADFFSHRLRDNFQNIARGQNGGRGFIFPYQMAETNNPLNYNVSWTGKWDNCKIVDRNTKCSTGLGGISIITKDSVASFSVFMSSDNQHDYFFNQVRLFHNYDTSQWKVYPSDTSQRYSQRFFPEYGYTLFHFTELKDSIRFNITMSDSISVVVPYQLLGLSLDNSDPGIVYHSSGVNGANIQDWLKSQYLQKHLSAINPDLIIISLGTNDSYSRTFNQQEFKYNYRRLVEKMKNAAPDAAFILTAPGDNYLYRRYLNRNISKAVNIIREIAQDQQLAFWNFYSVMGKMNSIKYWHNAGLTAHDFLHFNQKGYSLQGNLLFHAIMKAYHDHIHKPKQPKPKAKAKINK
ncbi:MAG: hypothetical protein K9H84_01305 [Bacteroidales bacterium]|nr:hypothetical protein [Bacteroidales bacterium]